MGALIKLFFGEPRMANYSDDFLEALLDRKQWQKVFNPRGQTEAEEWGLEFWETSLARKNERFFYMGTELFHGGGQFHWILILLDKVTGLEFGLLPGGDFLMGATEDTKAAREEDEPSHEENARFDMRITRIIFDTDGAEDDYSDERPVHEVRVEPFLLCRTPCTQAGWDKVGGKDERSWKGRKLPIEGVSWNDCVEWCNSADLRLPSEAEWEYACRAGTKSRYFFGNVNKRIKKYGWCFGSSGRRTHEVGKKPPNPFGLFDMYGNVWEWCQDEWHDDYEGAPTDGKPWEGGGRGFYEDSPPFRVLRGGSWNYSFRNCSSSLRIWGGPGRRKDDIGFRPARSLSFP